MKKILFIVAVIVVCFAVYGGLRLLLDVTTADGGKRVARVTNTLAADAASAAAERLRQTIEQTPDEVLQSNAEVMSRKFYPIAKGFLKGQVQALREDKDRDEIRRLMYEAGKEFSETVLKPFSRGVAAGSLGIPGGLEKTTKGSREATEEKGNLLDTISRGLESLQKDLREKGVPIPPLHEILPIPQTPAAPQSERPAPARPLPEQSVR